MNRREMLKSVGEAFCGISLLPSMNLKTEPVIKPVVRKTRKERYREYEDWVDNNLQEWSYCVYHYIVPLADKLYNELRIDKSHYFIRNQFSSIHLANIISNSAIYGDRFVEIIIDPEDKEPKALKYISLPAETMHRIQTNKGELLEFQQSTEGPDYVSLVESGPIPYRKNTGFTKGSVIRFHPDQIVHFNPGHRNDPDFSYGTSVFKNGTPNFNDVFENDIIESIKDLLRRFGYER